MANALPPAQPTAEWVAVEPLLTAVTNGPQPKATTDILLLVPRNDVDQPEISIVIPALNEELTIAEFVEWCKEGLKAAGVRGEVLIIDSSTDSTPELALEAGARVLKTPKRGLGRAYIDAIPFIRGKYLLLGDADLTYDFREIKPFLDRFREGYEYIMGSRFKGTIEDGAMPASHRYFGTPVTNWLLNFLYSANFSDIHCGMRGITRSGLVEMNLQSQEWEYAAEMMIKSLYMGLKTCEVPIHFHKDRPGRLSHHKRANPFSNWYAGWITLKVFFVHGASFFLYKPGMVLLAVGLLLTLPLSLGPVTAGPITFSLHWMLLGVTLTILGLQSVFMGILAKTLLDYSGAQSRKWSRIFSYNRSVVLSGVGFCLGVLLPLPLVLEYIRQGFRLPVDNERVFHLAITGLWLMMSSFLAFTNTLLLHALVKVRRWQK
jgi:glycosyltransferase involved in cell wall biosynthesis